MSVSEDGHLISLVVAKAKFTVHLVRGYWKKRVCQARKTCCDFRNTSKVADNQSVSSMDLLSGDGGLQHGFPDW